MATPADTHHTCEVLVVDQDPWAARAIQSALQQERQLSLAETALSGAAAVASYRKNRPDLVLMELSFKEGISGIEAAAAIRSIDATARIVVLTSVSPGPGTARALEAGVLCVLHKSVSPVLLRAVISQAAAGVTPAHLKRLSHEIITIGDSSSAGALMIPHLTPTEYEILRLICEGKGYNEIADARSITLWTAKSHVKRLREKLSADGLAQLIVRGYEFQYFSG